MSFDIVREKCSGLVVPYEQLRVHVMPFLFKQTAPLSPHSGDEDLHEELGQFESLSSTERKSLPYFRLSFIITGKISTIREQLDQINCNLLQEAW